MIDYTKNKSLNPLFYINENGSVCQEKFFIISEGDRPYKISDLGRIIIGNKVLNSRIKKGYNTARLYFNKTPKDYTVHRLVAQAFIPNPENKPCVNHKNGVKNDNRVENLEWSTISENTKHAFSMGLIKKRFGEKNNFTKYSDQTILEVKKLLKEGDKTKEEISAMFNINIRYLSDICLGRKRNNML